MLLISGPLVSASFVNLTGVKKMSFSFTNQMSHDFEDCGSGVTLPNAFTLSNGPSNECKKVLIVIMFKALTSLAKT